MGKYINLFVKNLGRNKMRTVLTAMAVMVLCAIYTFCSAVTGVVNSVVRLHSSENRLIIRERYVAPSRFPIRYVNKIASLEGVEDWTVWHFYGGLLGDAGRRAAGIATRIDNLREMHSGLDLLPQSAIDAMLRQRNGALVGARLMERMNWQVGQTFTLTSATHPGKNLEFHIIAAVESDVWGRSFFFREDYFQDAINDHELVNAMWIRVKDQETSRKIAVQIESMFEKSRESLRVETESAGVARFVSRTSTLVDILNFVVTILLINMVVVLATSINMTVRERRKEMAILKILGFPPKLVLLMTVGEAVTLGGAGGGVGAFLSVAISWLHREGLIPLNVQFLHQFPIPAHFIIHGILVGAAVGFVGSIIPAWNAQKVRVVEAFSRAG